MRIVDTLMAIAQSNIDVEKQLAAEIQQTPAEYLPALLTIVHSFRESIQQSQEQGIEAKRLAETQEALDDVEHGRLVDGDAVMAWVASWGEENERDCPIP